MSAKSMTQSMVEAIASKERDKIIDWIIALKPNQFWKDLWDKHGTKLDWPTTIMNAILQDIKVVPDPIRDFVMNSSEDLLDRIRNIATGKITAEKSSATPDATDSTPAYSMTDGMLKIEDTAIMNAFITAITSTGRSKEIMKLAGTEDYIDGIVARIVHLSANPDDLKQFVETLLGKKDRAKLETANRLKIRKYLKVKLAFNSIPEKKQVAFLHHLSHQGAQADEYLNDLQALSVKEIKKEMNAVYRESFSGNLDLTEAVIKRNFNKAKNEGKILGRRLSDWLEPRMFFLVLSLLASVGTILTGVFFNKPALIGTGIIVGLMIIACAWLFTGVLPLLSILFQRELFPSFIKKMGFWIVTGGLFAMLLHGAIHGFEAVVALILVTGLTILAMQITKFQTPKTYWIILSILVCLFSLTYIFPKNYAAICKSVNKNNKLWQTVTNTRSNVTDVKSMIRGGFTQKYIDKVYDTTGKIVKDVHLEKGLGVRYFDFQGDVKVTKKGIPLIQIMVPDQFNEYSDDAPTYLVEADKINVDQGAGLLSFIPIGKRELGVETSPDGKYSIKKWAEGGKEIWKITFKTDELIVVEDMPVGKTWIMSGAAFGDVKYKDPITGKENSYMFNYPSKNSQSSLEMKGISGLTITVTFGVKYPA
jgi:hypothetical protein